MSEQDKQRSEESLRHEYTEVAQNIRHCSNLRFAIFTIFFAVMGGIGLGVFGKGVSDQHFAVIARISGFGVIALLWFYIIARAENLFGHYVTEAIELERLLGYKQFTRRPSRTPYLPNFRVVGQMFFLLLMLLWAYAVFAVPLR
jgi:hypothetical protein